MQLWGRPPAAALAHLGYPLRILPVIPSVICSGATGSVAGRQDPITQWANEQTLFLCNQNQKLLFAVLWHEFTVVIECPLRGCMSMAVGTMTGVVRLPSLVLVNNFLGNSGKSKAFLHFAQCKIEALSKPLDNLFKTVLQLLGLLESFNSPFYEAAIKLYRRRTRHVSLHLNDLHRWCAINSFLSRRERCKLDRIVSKNTV